MVMLIIEVGSLRRKGCVWRFCEARHALLLGPGHEDTVGRLTPNQVPSKRLTLVQPEPANTMPGAPGWLAGPRRGDSCMHVNVLK